MKSSQRADTCEYKIDTGSDGILIPINMYKMLFLHMNVKELNMSIEIASYLQQLMHTRNGYM